MILGLGKIIGMGERAVVAATTEKLAAKTLSSQATKQAERFLTSTGDTLLGVRGNVAVVQNKAPFNSSLFMTSFYDITKPTNEALLKTKYVTNGKLDYIPFGIQSVACHIPQNARFIRQRNDVFPSEMGGFKLKSNIVTRFFDKFNYMVDKVNVKTRSLAGGKYERIVRSEYSTPQHNRYITLDPINKPKNGSIKGFCNINHTDGKTEYFIRKG